MAHHSLIGYLDNFHRYSSDIAYVHRHGYRTIRWSYGETVERACQFACELDVREIAKGDRVLIWGENCPEWIVAFWGCVLRGVVAVPMDRTASVDFVRCVAQQVDAKLLVSSREQGALGLALPTMLLETLRQTVARHRRTPLAAPGLQRENIVEIVFTSGSTAEPKGVVISHGNILAHLEPLESEVKKYLKYERIFHPIRFLNPLPLSHLFGQFLGIFVPQLMGATVIFQHSLNPSEVIRTIRNERVSVLVAVPRLVQGLKDRMERDIEAACELDWFRKQVDAAEGEHFLKRSWRFRRIHKRFGWKFWAFISGGAALDTETEAFWERLGFAVVQGYGLTEATSLVSVNHPFRLRKGSIGQVLPGQEIKLDESGEILVRGESIASGYWQDKEIKPLKGQEGWLHTGDLGELDEHGNLYFKGRKKDVMVTPEGMNVYPEDLEAALRRQPEVRDCVVVGLARNGNAEPCAVLILRNGGDPEPVVRRANQSLAEHQYIRHWFVWPEEDFPRTPLQKPRTQLIEQIAEAQLAKRDDVEAPADTLADLISHVAGRRPANLSPQANLVTDLNLSSIDRVELLSAIEDHYQIDVDEIGFTAATTVGELQRMLQEPRPQRTDYVYPRWAQRWPTNWMRVAGYYLLIWPATLLLGYPRVGGRGNLGGVKGPVLLIANHVTFLDAGLILAALPLQLRHRLAVAMLGERLQAMRCPPAELGFLMRWLNKVGYVLAVALFNVFPLPQRSGFRESFAFAGESADRGYSILVFPEGERTKDGKIAPFRAGIGLLANRLNVPIVPMRIDGLFELKQEGKKMAWPGTVKVTIGSPIQFDPDTDPESIAR
ncbi:AMP-binding protein, partial [Acidobacteria bacterium AH-259-A15]|nr:AMP-binding protein [Acidobacteria bacterium AH-259-A15]